MSSDISSVNLNNVCTAHSLTHSGFGTLQRTTSQCSTLRYQRGLFSVGSMATHSDTYRPAHYRQSDPNYARHAAAVDNAVTRSPSIDSVHKDPRWRAETNCSKNIVESVKNYFGHLKRGNFACKWNPACIFPFCCIIPTYLICWASTTFVHILPCNHISGHVYFADRKRACQEM